MPFIDRLMEKITISDSGCWEWNAARFGNGYGAFRFHGKNIHAHRASWILKYGEIPSGLFVCHKCDNRKCVNPDHLFLGSNQDNLNDMKSKGRSGRGIKNAMHRYSEEVIRRVKEMKVQFFTQKKTAQETGVNKSTISMIWSGKTWRHIEVPGFTDEDGRSRRWKRSKTESDVPPTSPSQPV